MNDKHMQLTIQNPFFILHSVQEAIPTLRYFIFPDLFYLLMKKKPFD